MSEYRKHPPWIGTTFSTIEENGIAKIIVYPTVRTKEDGETYRPRNPMRESLMKKDYLTLPSEKEAKALSKHINKCKCEDCKCDKTWGEATVSME